jgi:hypothetical protein
MVKANKKKTSSASEELMYQVTQEKHLQEEKKKQRAAEKKAEEDCIKVDKAQAIATIATISPPHRHNQSRSKQQQSVECALCIDNGGTHYA